MRMSRGFLFSYPGNRDSIFFTSVPPIPNSQFPIPNSYSTPQHTSARIPINQRKRRIPHDNSGGKPVPPAGVLLGGGVLKEARPVKVGHGGRQVRVEDHGGAALGPAVAPVRVPVVRRARLHAVPEGVGDDGHRVPGGEVGSASYGEGPGARLERYGLVGLVDAGAV